jgi:hypothetical protein
MRGLIRNSNFPDPKNPSRASLVMWRFALSKKMTGRASSTAANSALRISSSSFGRSRTLRQAGERQQGQQERQ